MGFVVDKAVLEQISFQYFVFFCQSFHRLLHTHHPLSGAGTLGQIVNEAPSGLTLTPHQESKKKLSLGLIDFSPYQ
jgi:hypothetical protein